MAGLTQSEVALMRSDEESGMHDSCVLIRHVVDVDEAKRDAYGDVDETPNKDGVETVCGFAWATVEEASRLSQHPTGVASVRLPHTASVENLGSVNVTRISGVALDVPLKFRVIGQPQIGISAVVLNLELLEEVTD